MKHNNLSFKIALSGIMFGLVLLFQFLEKYMQFGDTYMKFNLSLIFIMATTYIIGWRWGILLLLLRFAIGPAIGTYGYSAIGMWSHFVLFISGLIFMILFIIFDKCILKKIQSSAVRLSLASIISVMGSVVIMTAFNILFITPVYWYILSYINEATITKASSQFPKISPFFFGIKHYVPALITVYGVGNLIKFTIISLAFIPMWKALKHYI